jgi:GT2 family glycosyltransferase
VILNWNGRKFLEKFLPSVVASTYSHFNIVVADNASTDDSVPFLRSYYPLIRIVELDKNYGFAKGYNEALKQVQADYYVLLNSDVEVTPSWIEPVINLMEHDRSIAACQSKLLLYSDKGSFEYSGACGGWLDRFGYPFARGRIFDVCERDHGQYDTTEPVFWASGAAMFVRANVYHELGGLDEYFFAHQEEIDFCWRLQLAGYSVYCCHDSVVYHVGGGTLPKGNSKKVFLNFRNNLIMMAKNMRGWEAFWKINYRFILDTISAFKTLLEGEWHYFLSVFKAHAAFTWWLLTRFNRSSRGKQSIILKGYLHRSIVWSHFVLGMKKFSEIVVGKN